MRPRRDGGLVLASRVRDDHDRPFAVQHRARPRRVLAAEADVDAAREMRGGELRRDRARRGSDAPTRCSASTTSSVIGFSSRSSASSSVGRSFAVQHRVVGEVRRRVRLIGRDQVDERRLRHRLQRVVRPALLADGRGRLLAERLAAQRSRAVRGVDEARVGQGQQLRPQRVVQLRAEIGRPTSRATARRSGRPTSPTNSVSPVSTAYGSVALAVEVEHQQSRSTRACAPASRAPAAARARTRCGRRRQRRERVLGLGGRAQVDRARRRDRAARDARR